MFECPNSVSEIGCTSRKKFPIAVWLNGVWVGEVGCVCVVWCCCCKGCGWGRLVACVLFGVVVVSQRDRATREFIEFQTHRKPGKKIDDRGFSSARRNSHIQRGRSCCWWLIGWCLLFFFAELPTAIAILFPRAPRKERKEEGARVAEEVYINKKNANFLLKPDDRWVLAHALPRELDQSTAAKHDPHAYETSDSQRRNNDCNRARNISRI